MSSTDSFIKHSKNNYQKNKPKNKDMPKTTPPPNFAFIIKGNFFLFFIITVNINVFVIIMLDIISNFV